jgi:hypothetical protein
VSCNSFETHTHSSEALISRTKHSLRTHTNTFIHAHTIIQVCGAIIDLRSTVQPFRRDRERERLRERQTDRQTNRQTDRQIVSQYRD